MKKLFLLVSAIVIPAAGMPEFGNAEKALGSVQSTSAPNDSSTFARTDSLISPRLNINSKPEGCRVLIDNQLAGVTPLSIELAKGDRKISLSAKSHAPIEVACNLKSDTTLFFELKETAKLILEISSKIPHSEIWVFVNGLLEGKTDTINAIVEAGSTSIKVASDGFDDFEKTVFLKGAEVRNLPIGLVSENALIDIDCMPDSVDVFIDGKSLGLAPLTGLVVIPGEHSLKLRKKKYEDLVETLFLSANEVKPYHFKLKMSRKYRIKEKGFKAGILGTVAVALVSSGYYYHHKYNESYQTYSSAKTYNARTYNEKWDYCQKQKKYRNALYLASILPICGVLMTIAF